jgi:hypothetical protein
MNKLTDDSVNAFIPALETRKVNFNLDLGRFLLS